MQGEADRQRELLDVEVLAGHLLVPGSVFAFLAEHRLRLFPPEMFADLFPSGRGRPSVPPEVIASVLVLQSLYGLSDREAVEALTFDLRWKAACGYAVGGTGFHPTTLTVWRRRLAASERPDRIFEAVREVITATGALAGRTRRALDSTVLDDAVARQDTITQLIASVRRVGRDVPGATDLVATHCTRLAAVTGGDYSTAGKPRIAWDDETAREELVSALVGDALALLSALEDTHHDEAGVPNGLEVLSQAGGKAAEALALLALVAGQDVEPVEGSDGTDGRWRIARRTAPDRMISTVDPDARHAHKTRERRQDGFKAHVVVEPDTGLMTMVKLTKTNGADNSDAAVGADLVTTDPTVTATPDVPVQVFGDSAYASGEMLATLDAQRWAPVLKPWPLRPAVKGGFTLDDFTHDPTAGTLTCPAGTTRTITPKGNAVFGAACLGCPLRVRCTTAKDGRTIRLGEHHQLQRQHRQRATDPDFQAVYRRHRPMVERSIAWLTRGARRVPYRGVPKNDAWLHHRAAGLNLRRLLNLGLTIEDGTWAIA